MGGCEYAVVGVVPEGEKGKAMQDKADFEGYFTDVLAAYA